MLKPYTRNIRAVDSMLTNIDNMSQKYILQKILLDKLFLIEKHTQHVRSERNMLGELLTDRSKITLVINIFRYGASICIYEPNNERYMYRLLVSNIRVKVTRDVVPPDRYLCADTVYTIYTNYNDMYELREVIEREQVQRTQSVKESYLKELRKRLEGNRYA